MTAKKLLSEINVPDGMSVILRTSGLDTTKETLEWDMNYLIQIFEQILESSVLKKAPFLIYEESSMLARVIRDYIDETVQEVIIDDEKYYNDFVMEKIILSPTQLLKLSIIQNLFHYSVILALKHKYRVYIEKKSLFHQVEI